MFRRKCMKSLLLSRHASAEFHNNKTVRSDPDGFFIIF